MTTTTMINLATSLCLSIIFLLLPQMRVYKEKTEVDLLNRFIVLKNDNIVCANLLQTTDLLSQLNYDLSCYKISF